MVDESDFVQDAKASMNGAITVIDGVSSGFLVMIVPLVSIGLAVALGSFLLRLPVQIVNRRMSQ